jgi:hypothetical protein
MSKSDYYSQRGTGNDPFGNATDATRATLHNLKEKNMEKEIAVRFYTNEKFGSAFRQGKFRKAVFNGTADLIQPCAKYLLDMLSYTDWENTAKTDEDMQALAMVADLIEDKQKSDVLATFIKRLDSDGSKTRVFGFGVMDLNTRELMLLIKDDEKGVAETWQLVAKPCKQTHGKKIPQLLASNADLH